MISIDEFESLIEEERIPLLSKNCVQGTESCNDDVNVTSEESHKDTSPVL